MPLELVVVALDREGNPRAGLGAEQIRADIVPLAGNSMPAPLEPQLAVMPLVATYGDRPTGSDGATTVRFERLPPGLYRIEVTVDGQLVRPVPVVCPASSRRPRPRCFRLRGRHAAATPPRACAGKCVSTLPQSTHLKLDLYDVRGAHVRVVAEGRFAPGEHELPRAGL